MINLLVTLDQNYINPLCAMLKSLKKSNSNESFTLFVAHSKLTANDFEKINFAVSGMDMKVVPVKMEDNLFEGAPFRKRLAKEAYYRLFAPVYLPQNIDRVLYIDPDTIVINPLKDFYNMPFRRSALIAARHLPKPVEFINKIRLSTHKSEHYANSGVMLMNLDEMRRTFDKNRVYEIINKKGPLLFQADQDVINVLYDGKIKFVSEYLINLDERCFRRLPQDWGLDIVKSSTIIVHYNGKYKPWKPDYRGSLDCLWYEYDISQNVIQSETGMILQTAN